MADMQKESKKRVSHRLKIIEGQVRGLQKMVAEEKYCIDIITQASAVRRALSSVEDVMLENHLATHVIEQMKKGQHKKAIDEILSVYTLAKSQR